MPSSCDTPGDSRVGELLNHEEAHSPKGKGKDWKPHQDSEVTQGSEGVDRIYDQTISSSLGRPKSHLHHSGLPPVPFRGGYQCQAFDMQIL